MTLVNGIECQGKLSMEAITGFGVPLRVDGSTISKHAGCSVDNESRRHIGSRPRMESAKTFAALFLPFTMLIAGRVDGISLRDLKKCLQGGRPMNVCIGPGHIFDVMVY